jgi:hypothetical protein
MIIAAFSPFGKNPGKKKSAHLHFLHIGRGRERNDHETANHVIQINPLILNGLDVSLVRPFSTPFLLSW